MRGLLLAFKFALRDMRGGISGFRVFFLCFALGSAAIASVGSFSSAMLAGLREQGRVLLGGDIAVGLVHRPASAREAAFLADHGRISETVSMRSMAYAVRDGEVGERQLVELKAVDPNYPLFGKLALSPKAGFGCAADVCNAAVEVTLLNRLHIGVGGMIRIGVANFRVAAILSGEPDRISGGFSLGPHVLISTAALPRTGLVQPGSLINYSYRVALWRTITPESFRREATAAFPDAGWEIRSWNNAAPGLKSFVQQATMFLSLAGLAALGLGGIGASGAVRAFLARKREQIATLKSLGADGTTVFLIFFAEVMAVALAAVATGLLAGALLPLSIGPILRSALPVTPHFDFYARPLIVALLFAILTAIAFTVPPLAHARAIVPASLFRDVVAPAKKRAGLLAMAVAGAAALGLAGLAVLTAPSPLLAGELIAGVAIALLLLRLGAVGLKRLLARAAHARSPLLHLALADLARPGAPTADVIAALGLGLTLITIVSLLDRTISAQVEDALPKSAPSFFFVDIQPDEAARFDATIRRFAGAHDYRRTPMIRGRIMALNGVAAKDAKVAPESRWALAGDRGISYAAAMPDDAKIVDGSWWPSNYVGPTLISFDADLAKGMGLKPGSTMTLNVLGREIEGRIANLREVNFRNGRQNFILVLSPGLIDKAPHSFLATVRVDPKDEEPLYRAVTDAFPNVSTVRVKEAIAAVDGLLQELAFGVRVTALFTIAGGLLVVAGAIAAGARAHLYDATVLKVLGATRSFIAGAAAIEYGLLGILTGAFALVIGTLAASAVSQDVLEVPLIFDLPSAALVIVGGGIMVLILGLIGSWQALAARPAKELRARS